PDAGPLGAGSPRPRGDADPGAGRRDTGQRQRRDGDATGVASARLHLRGAPGLAQDRGRREVGSRRPGGFRDAGQRASSQALLAVTGKRSPHPPPSYSAKAEYPIRRGLSVSLPPPLEYWIVRSSRTMTGERAATSRVTTGKPAARPPRLSDPKYRKQPHAKYRYYRTSSRRIHFDTSGKSPVTSHHHTIVARCAPPLAMLAGGRMRAAIAMSIPARRRQRLHDFLEHRQRL